MTTLAQLADTSLTPALLARVAEETPVFVFDRGAILGRLGEFRRLFPGALIQYAIKANSEPAVLQILSEAGCGFEVASLHELTILRELGVPAERVVYGTSVKPRAHIEAAFAYGVDRFAVDSLAEIEKVAAAAPGARVYVRTTTNDAGSVFKFSEKFGTDRASIVPQLVHARTRGLAPYGVSFHVGSQASNVHAWATTLAALTPVMVELEQLGIVLDVINIGGGYPGRYLSDVEAPSLEAIASTTLAQYEQLPYQPQLMLEPGRGIVSDTAVAVASVIARIERRGTTWLFLDLGVYNGLFEVMAYQGSTRYPVSPLRPSEGQEKTAFALAGPTGDSPDVITRDALLPADISVGDKVVIHNVGAYSLSVTSRFNGWPQPAVCVL